MADGWSEFGNVLAGGGAAKQQQLYEQGATGVARVQGLLAEARLKRDEDLARSSLTNNLTQTGVDAPTANLISSALRGGFDPRQISGYQRQAQETGIQGDAYDRVKAGAGIDAVNPMLAVLAGKPVELSKVQDGVSLNPYVTPDQNTFDPTKVGIAEIMQKGAQARASDASAASSYASAARSRAGINSDKAANYDIIEGDNGAIRLNKLTGEATPVTLADGTAVKKAAGAGKGPNEQQVNAAGFAARMQNSSKELDDLAAKGYSPTNWIDRTGATIGGAIGNGITTNNGQLYHQAATNWVRANLRKESGAAIGADEMDQEVANYFPVAGDTADVVAQKSANRKLVEDNMVAAAGPAYRGPAAGAAAASPPAATASAPSSIPPAAANHLRENPALAAAFDQKYGAGAAAAVLGH